MFDLKLTEDDYRDLVQFEGGELVTTSLKVAQTFGKSHGKVLRDIRKLSCSAEFRQANFGSSSYITEQGKAMPLFTMTRDGWMFVVMGFTGEKAGLWKEAYIRAFRWMETQLRGRAITFEQRRNEVMLEIKQEEAVASLAGRTLCRWKYRKPVLHSKMLALEHEGQTQLKLH